jgi:Domain of unknown function (DUF4394)
VRAGLAAAIALLAAAPGAQAADLFYGVTESDRLVSFASDSPGAVRSSVPISGTLEAENVIGIDVQPGTGRLFGLGSANVLYRIEPGSGQATPAGPMFEVPIRGAGYGFDISPASGLVRVVSDSELNMRLNPEDGTVVDRIPESPSVQPDVDLHYTPDSDENVSALAYPAAGAPLGIDTERDTLVRLDPEDEGVLSIVGALGFDVGDPTGFDIDAQGEAYAVLRRGEQATQELVRIDVASGAATPAAGLSSVGTFLRGRPDPLRALAVVGTIADDSTRPGLVFTLVRTPRVRGLLRRRPLVILASCSEACRLRAVLRSGRRPVTRATSFVRESAGVVRMRLTLGRRGRRVVRRHPSRRLRLDVTARDAAGNVTTTRRPRRRAAGP